MNKPPSKCPECNSYDYDCDGEQCEEDSYYVYMRCHSASCRARWTEIYTFHSFTVEPFDPPDRFD